MEMTTSDAKMMAELAAEVAEKGYDWKQRALKAEAEIERLKAENAALDEIVKQDGREIARLNAEIGRLRDAGLEAQANEARAVEAAERLRAVLEEIKQTSEPGRGAYILASRGLLLCS